MIDPNHECSWTRKRLSELRRSGDRLVGAAIFPAVLERTAELLATTLDLQPNASDDDNYENENQFVTIGEHKGHLHDACFVGFDRYSDALARALIRANLDVHSFYLGAEQDPRGVDVLMGMLGPETTLVMRSRPAKGLFAKAYPNTAGWWARRMTPWRRLSDAS